jgi:hypothetical protein
MTRLRRMYWSPSMSDEIRKPNHEANEHTGYESQDLSPKGVIYFMVGLALAVVVIYFIVLGMYHFLDNYEKAHQTPMSPMATPQADTRIITHTDTQAFPEPRLEENERTQLRQFIEDQDRKLATYNWVDKDKGIVQIPIDRAMDLIVQHGLPVRPGSAQSSENASSENSDSEVTSPAQTSGPAQKHSPKATAAKARQGD